MAFQIIIFLSSYIKYCTPLLDWITNLHFITSINKKANKKCAKYIEILQHLGSTKEIQAMVEQVRVKQVMHTADKCILVAHRVVLDSVQVYSTCNSLISAAIRSKHRVQYIL